MQTMATEYRRRLDEGELDALLQRIASGDREALADLYHRVRTTVYALALSYLKNAQDAEDVTQDAFVQIWESAPSYRPAGKAVAWMLTVTRNLCLMRLRRSMTEPCPRRSGRCCRNFPREWTRRSGWPFPLLWKRWMSRSAGSCCCTP